MSQSSYDYPSSFGVINESNSFNNYPINIMESHFHVVSCRVNLMVSVLVSGTSSLGSRSLYCVLGQET